MTNDWQEAMAELAMLNAALAEWWGAASPYATPGALREALASKDAEIVNLRIALRQIRDECFSGAAHDIASAAMRALKEGV